ncbi:MAG: phage tail sheath family protein [Verrucomicrobia bacterium]|nr:phage tail sheath family protein [Verrucomicrobiota bacterium]
MPTYKTPDVYVEEISVFPPSVAEVETAVPAFIGYTEKALKKSANDLIQVPTKIYSLKEYEQYFGGPEDDAIAIIVADDGAGGFTASSFTEPSVKYLLYYSVKLFFDNGGGQCYITSVGTYQATPAIDLSGDSSSNLATMYGLQDGLNAVALEDEPTLIVIPEAVKLSTTDYQTLVQAVLAQCDKLRDRFAIFDIRDGTAVLDSTAQSTNRGYFGNNYLKYGAAYYPFIKTTMNFFVNSTEANVTVTYGATSGALSTFSATGANSNTSVYNFVKNALKEHFLVLPPSGAVAGVYAATDTNRGVWKAPANVSLADVIEPVIKLDNAKQDSLNVDATSGKSINALRAFAGKGTLVWGARTLAGNDNEWRYVPVRRFFNMVEESVKKSTYWAVFEPNDANTWVKVRGMIENYLMQKWREGALAGATPKDAFFVKCGLGTTMNAQDILEGRMNVEIGMAAVRPAEFIILKFSHKLQTS